MIEINIGALVVLLGIPTAVTGFCFWMLEHRIQKLSLIHICGTPRSTPQTRRRTPPTSGTASTRTVASPVF